MNKAMVFPSCLPGRAAATALSPDVHHYAVGCCGVHFLQHGSRYWQDLVVAWPDRRRSCSMTTDTEAYVAITRLQASYADVVTRRAWDELDELFVPQASIRIDTVTQPVIDITGPRDLAEFVATAVARFEFFEFVIL